MNKFLSLIFIFLMFTSKSVFSNPLSIKIFDVPVEKSSLDKLKNGTLIPDMPVDKDEITSLKMKKDIKIEQINGIYFIKLDTKQLKGKIIPHYLVHLDTAENVYKQTGARLVVNAGFFDPKNEQTVSYLTKDGKQILDPHNNANLTGNKHLQPYLDLIFNRSEFRVLKSETDDDDYKYDIAPHNEEPPKGYFILHSIQGGPALAPILRLEEEFFVLSENGKIISQSASSLSKYARTLIGIKNNDVYIVIAPVEHPITLPEASDIMKAAGFMKAMAFDGGGSVSLEYRDKDLHIISEKNKTARKLKSFLLITD